MEIARDGTVADVITSEVVLGGIHDHVEFFANDHRTRCLTNPVELCHTCNPAEEAFENIYLVKKCSTKRGWSSAAPDENLTMGFQAEFQDLMGSYTICSTGEK